VLVRRDCALPGMAVDGSGRLAVGSCPTGCAGVGRVDRDSCRRWAKLKLTRGRLQLSTKTWPWELAPKAPRKSVSAQRSTRGASWINSVPERTLHAVDAAASEFFHGRTRSCDAPDRETDAERLRSSSQLLIKASPRTSPQAHQSVRARLPETHHARALRGLDMQTRDGGRTMEKSC